MRAFSAKFSMTPLAAKLLKGSKKVSGVKLGHGPPPSSCKVWWKSNDALRYDARKCDVFTFFVSLFVTLMAGDGFGDVVLVRLLQQ